MEDGTGGKLRRAACLLIFNSWLLFAYLHRCGGLLNLQVGVAGGGVAPVQLQAAVTVLKISLETERAGWRQTVSASLADSGRVSGVGGSQDPPPRVFSCPSKRDLTSIRRISVSFLSGMMRGTIPSAGTGSSISSPIISSGGEGETVDMLDVCAPPSTISSTSTSTPHTCGLCCITDTRTGFCWSSSDSGCSLYVDIFSWKRRENRFTTHLVSTKRQYRVPNWRSADEFSLGWKTNHT